MSKSISLVKAITITETGKAKLDIRAEGVNMTGKIFAIQVLPASADPENPEYMFSHVCTPMELYEFPENPQDSDLIYFRTDDIELLFDTVAMAERTLRVIMSRVEHLIFDMNALESTAISIGSPAIPDVISILSAPPEFQFSEDGEAWHEEQTNTDVYIRFRNSALKSDWSTKVMMPVRQ